MVGADLKDKAYEFAAKIMMSRDFSNQENRLNSWIWRQYFELIQIRKPSRSQKHFVQTFVFKIIMDILCKRLDQERSSQIVFDLLNKLKGMKPTILN